MTMHSEHARTGSPREPVLFDGCARCAEHASHPLTLSPDHMQRLWDEMWLVEFAGTEHYYSALDAKAGAWLYSIAIFLERYATGLDPTHLPIQPKGD